MKWLTWGKNGKDFSVLIVSCRQTDQPNVCTVFVVDKCRSCQWSRRIPFWKLPQNELSWTTTVTHSLARTGKIGKHTKTTEKRKTYKHLNIHRAQNQKWERESTWRRKKWFGTKVHRAHTRTKHTLPECNFTLQFRIPDFEMPTCVVCADTKAFQFTVKTENVVVATHLLNATKWNAFTLDENQKFNFRHSERKKNRNPKKERKKTTF